MKYLTIAENIEECPVCGNPEFHKQNVNLLTFKSKELKWITYQDYSQLFCRKFIYFVAKTRIGNFEIRPNFLRKTFTIKFNGTVINANERSIANCKRKCQEHISRLIHSLVEPKKLESNN